MAYSFQDLGIPENLTAGLAKQGIDLPTPIQEQVIPAALLNRDLAGEGETGSGKTLAYLLPIMVKIQAEKRENQAIILVPTHELAIQVNNQIKTLAENSGVKITSTVIIGDVNIQRQVDILKKEKPQILVGSTGRLLELIKMKKISAHTVKTIVVDEADRLLDRTNMEGIRAIIKTTLRERQLMFFSAILPERILVIAKELSNDLQVIRVEESSVVNPNISHQYFVAERREKIEILRKLMQILKPQRAIAFVNRGYEIDLALDKLKFHGVKAAAIYGSIDKEDRKKALDEFRTGKANLLIASDIAARGLDIKDVDYVISLDMPELPDQYLHRAGRTGRAGETGISICIITAEEDYLIRKFENKFTIEFTAMAVLGEKIIPARKKSSQAQAAKVQEKPREARKSR